MPQVSIIIPFNNVESYIDKCLDSVISQTLQDIEIICVNDASSDKSRKIVEEYAKNDSRIKIIDLNKRQGQGFARNRAIEIATGEYIGFVDSDDWIEHDMFSELYNKAKENDDDIAICLANEYDDLNEKYITSDYYSLKILEYMGDRVFSSKDVQDKLLDVNVVLWNKIYKKSFLDRIGEKFPEGFIYEDLPFFFGTFLGAQKIQILWKHLYIYRINRKNSTMQQFNKKILDRLDMVSLTYEKLCKMDFPLDMINRIKGWVIDDLFHRYVLLTKNYHREFFFRMKQIFQSLDINDPENPFWKTVYHYEGYLLVLNNDFESFNQVLFSKYLDIREIENRLRLEFDNTYETDKKISLVYEEISKNYDYTNRLTGQLRKEFFEQKNYLNRKPDLTEDILNAIKDETAKYFTNMPLNGTQNIDKSLLDLKLAEIQSEYNRKLELIYERYTKDWDYLISLIDIKTQTNTDAINQQKDNILNSVDEVLEKERQNFEQILNTQKQEYEAEIKNLQDKITMLEKSQNTDEILMRQK